MERNGSFGSGYLCEILPSAEEPGKDLHVTQNSSEPRPNDSFSKEGKSRQSRGPVKAVQGSSFTSPVNRGTPGQSAVLLDQRSANFSIKRQIVFLR